MRTPLPIIEAPRTDGPEPETGTFGVGAAPAPAVRQRQLACEVQVEFLHAPPIHTSCAAQSVFTVQDWLHAATCAICNWVGVGVAVGYGVDVGVGVGLLYTIIGVAVGYGVDVGAGVAVGVGDSVGVGVFVGVGDSVGVGVFVGVGVGVTVPVGVGVTMLNVNVHAAAAARDLVGVTCLVWESFPLVKITMMASPIVRNNTRTKYQCFFT